MKKLLLTIAMAVAGSSGLITSAQAHGHCGGGGCGYYGGCYYSGPSYCGSYYDGCYDGCYDQGSYWYYRHHDRDHDRGRR